MSDITIKDIAQIAGVGVSTISRVINSHPDVNEETRRRVMEIIKKYDYVPNGSARNLKISESKSIGVLVKGITNPFFVGMIKTIEKQVKEKGYTMILQQVGATENEIKTAVALTKEKRLNGVIFLGGSYTHTAEDLAALSVPFVFTTATLLNCDATLFSSVCIDDVKASKKATDHLISLGHRRIALMVSETYNHSIGELRLQGYKQSLSEHGIEFDEKLLIYADLFDMEASCCALAQRVTENPLDFTAVFAISDVLAIGAIRALIDCGIKVPDDVSVLGFDGQEITKFYNPTIETFKQPREEMAINSVKQLFRLSDGGSNCQEVFQTELMQGKSCTAPPFKNLSNS